MDGYIYWMDVKKKWHGNLECIPIGFVEKEDDSKWSCRFFLFLLDATRHVRFSAIIFRLPIFLFVHGQECSCAFLSQPISIDCQVLFIFFFSGRLCRNRYCTFLDFQNRFDKVCRIVFRFVHRPLADSFRRNLLQKWQCQCLSGFLRVFQDLKSGAHPYLPYDLAVCSCMDIIYIRFSVTYFLYSFHSAWSFLFSLERALPEKFHFFIEKIIRKSKQTSHFNGMFITQSRDCQ